MKSTKQWLQYIILGIIACAAGVFIFFQTENFAKVMVIGIGAFAFVNGSGALLLAAKSQFDEKTRSLLLIRGILGVVVGIVAILLPMATTKDIWSLMLYVLASELVISTLIILLSLKVLKKTGTSVTRSLINAGISTALALVIFIMPKEAGQQILSVIAAIIVIYGIAMIFAGVNRKKTLSGSTPKTKHKEKKGKKQKKDAPVDQEQVPGDNPKTGENPKMDDNPEAEAPQEKKEPTE